LLTFKAIGFLDAPSIELAKEVAASDVVQNILGEGFGVHEVAAETDPEDVLASAPARQAIDKAKTTAATEPAAGPLPAVVTKEKKVTEAEVVATIAHAEAQKVAQLSDDMEIDLDNITFDD
jgi:hypothetical protein